MLIMNNIIITDIIVKTNMKLKNEDCYVIQLQNYEKGQFDNQKNCFHMIIKMMIMKKIMFVKFAQIINLLTNCEIKIKINVKMEIMMKCYQVLFSHLIIIYFY